MNAETEIEAGNLIGALALALPKLEGAKATAENEAFKRNGKASKYSDLGDVIDAIRPVAEHGIWFRQVSHNTENGAKVETFYIGYGEQISAGELFVPASKANAHGFGSALTYARRYGLQTAFGLATEDDDGNAASLTPHTKETNGVTNDQITKIKSYCQALGGNTLQQLCEAKNVSAIDELSSAAAADAIKTLEKRVEARSEKENS